MTPRSAPLLFGLAPPKPPPATAEEPFGPDFGGTTTAGLEPVSARATPNAPPPTASTRATLAVILTLRRPANRTCSGSTAYSRGPSPESVTTPPLQSAVHHHVTRQRGR